METEEVRKLICRFLASASVADHLGDIANAIDYLYEALGVDKEAMKRIEYKMVDTDSYAFDLLRAVAKEFNLPVPDYVLKDYED